MIVAIICGLGVVVVAVILIALYKNRKKNAPTVQSLVTVASPTLQPPTYATAFAISSIKDALGADVTSTSYNETLFVGTYNQIEVASFSEAAFAGEIIQAVWKCTEGSNSKYCTHSKVTQTGQYVARLILVGGSGKFNYFYTSTPNDPSAIVPVIVPFGSTVGVWSYYYDNSVRVLEFVSL